jgi:hypothetical protein
MGDERDVNGVPAETELTVLPADDAAPLKLGWTCHERMGVEVYPYDPADHSEGGLDLEKLSPITEEGGLTEGMQVLVAGLLGGFHVMAVRRDEHGVLSAKGERLTGILRFGEDDRGCWVCLGLVNMRAIEKLELRSG